MALQSGPISSSASVSSNSGIRIFASLTICIRRMNGFYFFSYTKVLTALVFATGGFLHQICWDQSDANIRIPLYSYCIPLLTLFNED